MCKYIFPSHPSLLWPTGSFNVLVGLMSISLYPALIPQFHSSNYYVIENKVFSKKKKVVTLQHLSYV